MKGVFLVIGVAMVSLGLAGNLYAQETLIDTVANGCKTEITTYCKEVTPGEGRILACLYAYEDKLSGQCEYALYDAAARLERAVAALTYVAKECEADIVANCSGVKAGEGRVLQCLEKNEAKVSKRCKGALKDVGLK
jgi:Cysteine rich repeat